MAKLNLTTPWNEYYNEISAFFGDDPDVNVIFDYENMIIKLYVSSPDKAAALDKLLVPEQVFGNVTLKIEVMQPNTTNDRKFVKFDEDHPQYMPCLFATALFENPIFSYLKTIDGVLSFNATYVVFKKQVLQYFTDDLGDINGIKSTLAQTIARDIFIEQTGIFFCTDTKDPNE